MTGPILYLEQLLNNFSNILVNISELKFHIKIGVFVDAGHESWIANDQNQIFNAPLNILDQIEPCRPADKQRILPPLIRWARLTLRQQTRIVRTEV